jgi:hypothetical protein
LEELLLEIKERRSLVRRGEKKWIGNHFVGDSTRVFGFPERPLGLINLAIRG